MVGNDDLARLYGSCWMPFPRRCSSTAQGKIVRSMPGSPAGTLTRNELKSFWRDSPRVSQRRYHRPAGEPGFFCWRSHSFRKVVSRSAT